MKNHTIPDSRESSASPAPQRGEGVAPDAVGRLVARLAEHKRSHPHRVPAPAPAPFTGRGVLDGYATEKHDS